MSMSRRAHRAIKGLQAQLCSTLPRAAAPASLLSSSSRLLASSAASSRSFPSASFHTSASVRASAAPQQALPGSTIDFNLADIGEGIAECEVLRWFIKEGDTIAQFDKVCEVQSDKANVEITSRYDGKVLSLKYAVGELAKVGKPLLSIQLAGSADPSVPGAGSIDTSAPDMQEPSVGIASRVGLAAMLAQGTGGQTALPGADLAASNEKVMSSPAVRRIAKEEGVNLAHVRATGPGGRILKEDVVNFIKGGRKQAGGAATSAAPAAAAAPSRAASAPAASASAAAPSSGSAAPSGAAKPAKVFSAPSSYLAEDKVLPITGLNRIMVQTMNAANAVPQLGYGDEICVDNLYDMRALLNKEAQAKYGVKLSYMPFILKACSMSLKHFPSLNAHTNADCSSVTHRSSHNLGLAMDTPRGLLVPNIKDVQNKSILDIAVDMARLAKAGQEGKLGREELTGGTFTISNIGSIGGTYLKPILVVPEVVIGALGAFQTVPRFDSAMQVKPTRIMNISWSADHRVVDGATMARFSNMVKHYLEHPMSMMLEAK